MPLVFPSPNQVLDGVPFGPVTGDEMNGTYVEPNPANYGTFAAAAPGYGENAALFGFYDDAYGEYYLVNGPGYGANGGYTGVATLPLPGNVTLGPDYGPLSFPVVATYTSPNPNTVANGTAYGENASVNGTLSTGNATFPSPQYVLPAGGAYGLPNNLNGTYTALLPANVRSTATYGPNSSLTGTIVMPDRAKVLTLSGYDANGTTNGTYNATQLTAGNVKLATIFAANNSLTGTLAASTGSGSGVYAMDTIHKFISAAQLTINGSLTANSVTVVANGSLGLRMQAQGSNVRWLGNGTANATFGELIPNGTILSLHHSALDTTWLNNMTWWMDNGSVSIQLIQ